MRTWPRVLLAAALIGAAAIAPAAPLDLHEHWDQRCAACHGHSAEFARRTLTVEQGRVAGRHHRDDLARFLRNHYLADELVEPMLQMLAAQAVQPPVFMQRCARCHETAAEFARRSLEWRDGALYGRSTGRPVGDYLATHGGLAAAAIAPMVETLTRVRREVASAP